MMDILVTLWLISIPVSVILWIGVHAYIIYLAITDNEVYDDTHED